MSARHDQRVILLIAAADRETANRDAESAVSAAGPRTFAVGLVPSGSPPGTPPSHYVASWLTTSEQRDVLRGAFDRVAQRRSFVVQAESEAGVGVRVAELLRSQGLVFHAEANATGRRVEGGVR